MSNTDNQTLNIPASSIPYGSLQFLRLHCQLTNQPVPQYKIIPSIQPNIPTVNPPSSVNINIVPDSERNNRALTQNTQLIHPSTPFNTQQYTLSVIKHSCTQLNSRLQVLLVPAPMMTLFASTFDLFSSFLVSQHLVRNFLHFLFNILSKVSTTPTFHSTNLITQQVRSAWLPYL